MIANTYSQQGSKVYDTYSAARRSRALIQRKREKALAKARLLLFSFAVMVLSMAVLSGFSKPQAADYGMTRYYTTVTVHNGDTLWDLAEEYYTVHDGDMRSYISEIETFNNIKAERIRPGQMIVIPYFAGSAN